MLEFQKSMSREELVAVLATINACIELIVWVPSTLEACRAIGEMRDDTLKQIEALTQADLSAASTDPVTDEHPPVRVPTHEEPLRHWRSYWANHPEQIKNSTGHPLAMLGAIYFEDYIKGPKWGATFDEFIKDHLHEERPVEEALISFMIDWGHDGDALPARFVFAVKEYCDHMLRDFSTPE